METLTKQGRLGTITRQHLILDISNRWQVYDFINMLDTMYFWYNLLLVIEYLDKDSTSFKLKDSFLSELGGSVNKEISKSLQSFVKLPTPEKLHEVVVNFPSQLQLKMKSINYNSPGKIDILGIGEIVKQVKEFIIDILNLRASRRRQRMELDERREKLKGVKIDNFGKTLELIKKYDLPIEFAEQLYHQRETDKIFLQGLSRERKIRGITSHDEHE